MAQVRRFDHVGITVSDLVAATAFFVGLGLEVDSPSAVVEGEFIDTVTGIPAARSEIVMLRAPGGETTVELSAFQRPEAEVGQPDAMANVLGIRSVAFEVDDLTGLVHRLQAEGHEVVGGIGRYEDAWLMAYVRGPDGIIVAIAESLG